jgi:hypothetical protein
MFLPKLLIQLRGFITEEDKRVVDISQKILKKFKYPLE